MQRRRYFRFVTRLLYWTRILQFYLFLERRVGWRRSVLCITHHHVLDEPPENPVSRLEQGVSAKFFGEQLRELIKYLAPLGEMEVLEWLHGATSLTADGFLVTFDDGYRDNLEIAAPMMQALGVPGLIFVATDFVGTEKVFWWTRLSDAIRRVDSSRWKMLLNEDVPSAVKEVVKDEDLETWPSRVRSRRRVGMLINGSKRPSEIVSIIEECVEDKVSHSSPLLSWSEIRSMCDTGFQFGSHTHTHACLSNLTTNEIERELQMSREVLLGELKSKPRSLAYPGGEYDQRAVGAARRSGYRLAFTTRRGVILADSNPLELPRVYLPWSKASDVCFALVALNLSKYFSGRLREYFLRLAG